MATEVVDDQAMREAQRDYLDFLDDDVSIYCSLSLLTTCIVCEKIKMVQLVNVIIQGLVLNPHKLTVDVGDQVAL